MMWRILCAGAAIVVAMPASAQSTSSVSAGLTGGTLGIGPELGFRGEGFGVRGNATFFGLGRTVESDGVNYDGDLKLRSVGLMADVYPFGGGFRLSAGARINNNRVELKATPTGDVEIGDQVYTPAEIGSIIGEVEAKKFAPTLTIGWASGSSAGRGLHFGIDAGAMFQGSPKVTELRTTGMLSDPALQADLQRERDEIEADIDSFKIYPVLQIGVGYRF